MADKLTCEACTAYRDAYLDGELDIATTAAMNAHLDQCSSCATAHAAAEAFSRALRQHAPRYAMPADSVTAVMRRLKHESKPAPQSRKQPRWLPQFTSGLAGAALAVIATLYIAAPLPSDRLNDEIVSDHVRSLMEHHLTDVDSSDRHTVKPWFTGKLDFSPAVVDFAADGYPLVGGRLDYLQHQPVAALSYRHGKHLINVFMMPSPVESASLKTQTLRGYNIVSGAQNHMSFYAVSDMNAEELTTLGQLLLKAMSS